MAEQLDETSITMLDGAALVTGAAVSSVHFRHFIDEIAGLTTVGWAGLSVAFGLLAVTAAGPFVFLVRRFSRKPQGYPRAGDLLWLVFGLPWLMAGLFASASGVSFNPGNRRYSDSLFGALSIAILFGLVHLIRTLSEPDRQGVTMAPRSWTDLVGRAISIGWPLQVGLGFVVTR